ncbi:uncharacterized protein LOC130612453 [Hydractinia symbiolongicarpus]|uniref:uncharacterized protein LOC130612453 n=1 Tax=Hydractinia symbiolongicarpus TaxID=13093 RepID=UPI00254C630D|nr:uncharacterized protein LOC130612453 [Hydractinia symbiolongicarpus]
MCAKYWKSVTILSNNVDPTDEGNLVQYCSKPNLEGICLQSIPDERKNGVDTHMVYEGKFFRKCKYDIASILVPQPIELLLCFGESKSRRLLGYGVEENLKNIQGGFFSHFKTRAVLFKTKLKNSEVPMSCQISTELQQHEENLAKEVEENKIDEVGKDDHETEEEVKERLPDENSNDGEIDDDSDNDGKQVANDSIKPKLGMKSVTE